MYDDYIMWAVRQNLGLNANDTSMDEKIASMPKKEVLERYLTWNGIIGYSGRIINVVECVYKVKLREDD